MRTTIQTLGLVIAAVGVSGTIDRLLGHQPLLGFLNVFNRMVIPRVEVLADNALFANLAVAVLGVTVLVAATRVQPSASRP